MPYNRSTSKRTLEEIVNAEDSNDDDYDDRAPGPSSKPRHARPHRSGPTKKKRKKTYGGSDVSDDDEELDSEEEAWSSEEEQLPIETNEKGRPIRRTVKKAITYEESDPDDKDELSKSSSEEDILVTPPRSKPKSKIVSLKISTPLFPSKTRSGRTAGGSHNKSRSNDPESPQVVGRRRSSRVSHDPEEPMVALSSSGRHVVEVRAGSREPETFSRANKGGKGIKYPSKSTIDEDEEPNSMATKHDEDGGEDEEEEDDGLEIKASQHDVMEEIAASQPEPRLISDLAEVAMADNDGDDNVDHLQASQDDRLADDDDDDEGPVGRGRLTRANTKRKADSPPPDEPAPGRRRLESRGGRTRTGRSRANDESSDFDPGVEQDGNEEMSASEQSMASPQKNSQRFDAYESSNAGRRSTRLRSKAASRQASASEDDDEIADELAEELAELKKDGKKKRSARDNIIFEPRGTRRGNKKPNYDLLRNLAPIEDDDEPAAPSPLQRQRKTGGGGYQRSLFNTYGPFGGAGAFAPVLGGPARPQGDGDSDSSDDEIMKQPRALGGTVGMTPTTATAPFNPFQLQPLNNDQAQATAGTPANLGKMKDKQALADADPLGVDQNVDFDSVGGLQGHIDQLKEMVALPLLYPEIFMRFHITPPRGVLFHGPPGTGKTLLARALATSVSSQGRKVTFYMRKGADALSKWVGEAERQLRLLFEEARKNQPSIIFFDEIDGLAPVRSSKQEQIHASIVSTLLALMDGMDGRGQVIVIGATNRPDSIDPALRRPGRFDREFYFPLPDTTARRSIIDIHTKGWNPPLDNMVKEELAGLTKGYGGADLRALCTEAALNAVQRRYPQIYSAKEKLLIDPKTIEVMPKDFMISIKKMTPSSERSASSGAAPLPANLVPLLEAPLKEIERLIADVLPQKKKTTALEEAMYEDVADGRGFDRERMQQAFESSRVFRPRLLIHGRMGMGQQYVAAALLNHLQGVHVQSFDLATLLSDTSSSPEATVIRLFAEVKMHKPSVIYIPNVQEWYVTVGNTVLSTFFGLLRSVKPTDPIFVLGVLECDPDGVDESLRREMFGYSKKNQYQLGCPGNSERRQFFEPIVNYVRTSPSDFPDPVDRKKRQLEILKPAPPEPARLPPPPSKEELKAEKKKDRQTLNLLKIRLQPIMDQIRTKYKKFRSGVVDEGQIRYLYDEADPGTVTSDLHGDILRNQASFRPFEVGKDVHGVPGLIDQASDKFYYNIDSVTIEKRLSNGYYKRPKDFFADIKRLAKDAKTIGDEDRLLKANELLANVEVDITMLVEPALTAECERVYQRELAREKELIEKARQMEESSNMPPPQMLANVAHGTNAPSSITTTTDGTGPITLGVTLTTAKDLLTRVMPTTPSRPASNSTNMTNGVHGTNGQSLITDSERASHSNHTGSGHEADVENDTPMGNSDSNPASGARGSHETEKTHTTSSFGNRESAQPRPYHSYTAPSQQLRRDAGMSGPLSQTEYMTPMAPGSQAADYQNDASTTQTTDGKRHSGPSSGNQNNTQETGPDLWLIDDRHSVGGSDIPDTQEQRMLASQPSVNGSSQSQREGRPISSQGRSSRPIQPPIPPFDLVPINQSSSSRPNGHLADLLNPQPLPNMIQAEHKEVESVMNDIVDKTSGLTVEQLEQVNSILMGTIWKTKSEWNRQKVLDEVLDAFNETLKDMRAVGQDFGPLSWEALHRGNA